MLSDRIRHTGNCALLTDGGYGVLTGMKCTCGAEEIRSEVAALEVELATYKIMYKEQKNSADANYEFAGKKEAQVARLTEALMKIMLGFLSSKEMRYVAKEALDA